MKIKTLLAVLLGTSLMHAAETVIDAKAQTTRKAEVTSSMIGYRDTLLFYTFADQKAVLVVNIDNSSDKFPIVGRLHVFAPTVKAEDLANWINNQHSCGIFPDVPNPTATHQIPVASSSVVSKKMMGAVDAQGPEANQKFNCYQVEFKIEKVPAFGDIQIKDFTDAASVYVKIDDKI